MVNSNCNNQSPAVELEMVEGDGPFRPLSLYDNKSLEEQPLNSTNNNDNSRGAISNRSQINFLNTTVPQNIMVHDFVGKHTPTRNSLRHSRLITLNRSGQVLTQTPIVLRYQKLTKVLLVCMLIIGLGLCIESLWLLLWTPNLKSKDNPGWTGIPVLVSSVFGILFISSIPKNFNGHKLGYWRNFLKFISITLSLLAIATLILTIVFSVLHLIYLSSMTCAPSGKLDSTCLCKYKEEVTKSEQSYHYIDLNCEEVEHVLKFLIIFNCSASVLVLILEIIYLYIHWLGRNVFEYSRVSANALNIYRANR